MKVLAPASAPVSPGLGLTLALALVLACSGPNEKRPEKAEIAAIDAASEPEPAPPEPEPSGPEVVERSLAPDEVPRGECISDPIDGGVLDQTSDRFTRIEVRSHPHVVEQRATLASGGVVIARLGGCDRSGVSYTVVLPADRPTGHRAHYIGAALDVVKALPVRADSRHYKAEIEAQLRPALSNPGALGLCVFPTGAMAQVACDLTAEGDEVHVRVAYEIRL